MWGPLGALGGLGRPGRCSCRVEAAPGSSRGEGAEWEACRPASRGPGAPEGGPTGEVLTVKHQGGLDPHKEPPTGSRKESKVPRDAMCFERHPRQASAGPGSSLAARSGIGRGR